jgi:hypothetical protein
VSGPRGSQAKQNTPNEQPSFKLGQGAYPVPSGSSPDRGIAIDQSASLPKFGN